MGRAACVVRPPLIELNASKKAKHEANHHTDVDLARSRVTPVHVFVLGLGRVVLVMHGKGKRDDEAHTKSI